MRLLQISKLFLFVLAVSLFIVGANAYDALAAALDGKTYSIEIKEHNKDGETRDDIVKFKDGEFLSKDCEQYGFGSAPYEYREKDNMVLFISSTKSEKEGEIQWEGKVEGDKISGTMIWMKTGQDPIFYKYNGSLKK